MRPSSRNVLLTFLLSQVASACRSPQPAEDPWEPPRAQAPRDAAVEPPRIPNADLEPGTLRTFGLLLPIGTEERLVTESERMYYVSARVSAVMRYLQRRLLITEGEIHPLGAMIRGASLRDPEGGTNFTLDLAVREEGERTLITFWNRTAAPITPRSQEDGLRAAGIDPRTGQPLPGNNH